VINYLVLFKLIADDEVERKEEVDNIADSVFC
jgi:hypothetical protein